MKEDSNTPTSTLELPDSPDKPNPKTYDLSSSDDINSLFSDKISEDEIKKYVSEYLKSLQTKYALEKYFIIVLYDEHSSLDNYEANKIYEAASRNSQSKNILLVINNLGGKVESAYLISKTCQKLAKDRFVVAIPRRAKSAATLITLGADEIHMGLMSELGPIDPQIGGYPALGLGNSLNVLAELARKYPESSSMFAQFLAKKLELKDLGYFERVTESAAQYAERLLRKKKLPMNQTPQKLAKQFVYHYKDHSFVIDMEESTILLGDLVKPNTIEYNFANDLYKCLAHFDMLYTLIRSKDFSFVGTLDDFFILREQPV